MDNEQLKQAVGRQSWAVVEWSRKYQPGAAEFSLWMASCIRPGVR